MRYAPQSFRVLAKVESGGEAEYVTRVTQVTDKINVLDQLLPSRTVEGVM